MRSLIRSLPRRLHRNAVDEDRLLLDRLLKQGAAEIREDAAEVVIDTPAVSAGLDGDQDRPIGGEAVGHSLLRRRRSRLGHRGTAERRLGVRFCRAFAGGLRFSLVQERILSGASLWLACGSLVLFGASGGSRRLFVVCTCFSGRRRVFRQRRQGEILGHLAVGRFRVLVSNQALKSWADAGAAGRRSAIRPALINGVRKLFEQALVGLRWPDR